MYNVKEVGYSEWKTHLKSFEKTNLMQYWQYGSAKEETGKWKAIRLVVFNNEKVIALAQFLIKTFPKLGGIARMNRGPMLIKEITENDKIKKDFEKLKDEIDKGFKKLFILKKI